jgi:hypothetical protein
MRTAAIFGVIAAFLTLVNLTALFAVATATHMPPQSRVVVLGAHVMGLVLFAALTALLLRKASA